MSTSSKITFSVFKYTEKPKVKTKTQKPSPSHMPLFKPNKAVVISSKAHHTTKPSRKCEHFYINHSDQSKGGNSKKEKQTKFHQQHLS